MASSKLISLKFVLVLSFSLHFSSSLVTSQAFFEVEVVLFVGAYNSCLHGCKYCYANFDSKQIVSNYKMHDVNSSLLIGHLNLDDQVKIRRK